MPRKPFGPPTFDATTPARLARTSPVCRFCAHLRPGPGRTCDAFNAKTAIQTIPPVVWLGENPHKVPLDGQQNAIVWQVRPEAEAGARLAGLIE